MAVEKSNQILEMKGTLEGLVGVGGAGTAPLSSLFSIKRACEPLVTKYGVTARLDQVQKVRGPGVVQSAGHSGFKQGVQGHFPPSLEEKGLPSGPKTRERIHM